MPTLAVMITDCKASLAEFKSDNLVSASSILKAQSK